MVCFPSSGMKALTLSELLRRGNAHQFVFGFRRWEILSLSFIFPSFDVFTSSAPQVTGCRRPATENFSSRPGTLTEDADVWSSHVCLRCWSKDLSDIWVVERRRNIKPELDSPPNDLEMINHHLLQVRRSSFAAACLIKDALWSNVLLCTRFCL